MNKFLMPLLLFGFLAACAISPGSKNIQLVRASELGQVDKMQELIKNGADVNCHDAEGWTPYLAASSNGHFEAMRLLRGLGAKTAAPEMGQYSFQRFPLKN